MYYAILIGIILAVGYGWYRSIRKEVRAEVERETIQKEEVIYHNEVDSVRTIVTDDDVLNILRDKSAAARKLESKSK